METPRGYTLLELLICLLILSILARVSIGGFGELLESRRSELALKEIAQSVHLARSAAIKNNSLVTICRSTSGSECEGDWSHGGIVFVDRDGDRELDGEDELLRRYEFMNLGGNIRWRAFQNRQWLQITPLGFTRYQNGNFTFCPDDGDATGARQLIINRSGRMRFAQDRDGDGIVENSRGKPLSCP